MDKSIHIAPMMGWSDRHGRFFMRLLSSHARLWTEMVAAPALIYGDRAQLCRGAHHQTVLQIGGSDPDQLATAARIGEAAGYGEINLNMGCPSCRVKAGGFGAAMMADLAHAADCVRAMAEAVSVPISVKCRIAIDHQIPEEVLPQLLARLSQAGAKVFTIHARSAWLKGLSPKQNRTLPPLNYGLVYEMKRQFPSLSFIINGGIQTLDEARQHLQIMDGVMIGRAAFRDPFMLADLDRRFFNDPTPIPSRQQVFAQITEYALNEKLPLAHFIRLVSGLWTAKRGAGDFRRRLNVVRVLTPEVATDLFVATEKLAA